jgi:hypothetical protein
MSPQATSRFVRSDLEEPAAMTVAVPRRMGHEKCSTSRAQTAVPSAGELSQSPIAPRKGRVAAKLSSMASLSSRPIRLWKSRSIEGLERRLAI